jgi:hypothetical protein
LIRIIDTNKSKLTQKSSDWQNSKSAMANLDINNEPITSQNDVDAIANAMDESNAEIIKSNDSVCNDKLCNPSKEEVAQQMIRHYINKNGSVILQNSDKKENKNRLILG